MKTTDLAAQIDSQLHRGWNHVDPQLRHQLETLCTPAELQVAKLKAAGYGRRRGSLALGISEEAWRYRWRNILAKLTRQEAA